MPDARSLLPVAPPVTQAYPRRGLRRAAKVPSVDQLFRRYESAKSARENFLRLWADAYEYMLPHRNLLGGHSPGSQKNERVFDSTGIEAIQNFAGELMMALTPPFRRWIELKAGTDIPTEHRDSIDEQLEEQTRILFEAIDHSNFATEINESLLDLAIGTGALLLQDSGDDYAPLRFTAVPLAQLIIEEGPRGTIETVFRNHSVPARNLERLWPQARWSATAKTLMTQRPDEEVPLVEGTIYDEASGNYLYTVIEENGKHLALADTLEDTPWIVFRWMKVAEASEPYGRGPALTVLPDVKTLNRMVELHLRNAALATSGVYLAVDDGVLNPWNVELSPGSIIPVMRENSLQPLERSGDLQFGSLMIERLQASIRAKMYEPELPPLEGQPRTATELLQRNRILLRKIGSSFGRLQQELVFRTVQKAVGILTRRGKMAPIRINGREVDARYVGPLAQAQDQQDLEAVEQYMTLVGAMGPEIMMAGTRVEDIPAYIGKKLGIPQSLLRDEAEREQIKQRAAEVAEAQLGADEATNLETIEQTGAARAA